jgi:hypothetical protein
MAHSARPASPGKGASPAKGAGVMLLRSFSAAVADRLKDRLDPDEEKLRFSI